MSQNTDAPDSALGYMYQTFYALNLLLTSDPTAQIYIEKLEDIQLQRDGNAIEALQLKHSIKTKPTNLSNKSKDFWNTLGNWSDRLKVGDLKDVLFLTLITVSKTSPNSIPASLENTTRDNNEIVRNLMEIVGDVESNADSNHHLYKHIIRFKALTPSQRLDLVGRIQVIPQSDSIASIVEIIKKNLQIHPEFRDSFYERVIGWWSERVRKNLIDQTTPITKYEYDVAEHDIREDFTRDKLPLSFENVEPPQELFEKQDLLRFVQQLTLIEMTATGIENAIRDYYRAFSERKKWLDTQVIQWDELKKYERRLKENWFYYWESLNVDLELENMDDVGRIRFGKKLYLDLMKQDIPRIRSLMTANYIGRGSYHILADYAKPRVWWHPEFVERLKEKIKMPVVDGDELSIYSIEPVSGEIALSIEQTNLLNPAFGTVVLYEAIKGYNQEASTPGMPYLLLQLVFPLVLNSAIRKSLPKTYKGRLLGWTQKHPEHIPYIQSTFKDLKRATNQSLLFAGQRKTIEKVQGQSTFTVTPQKRLVAKKYAGIYETEVDEIRKMANRIGRILARSNVDARVIYNWFGV